MTFELLPTIDVMIDLYEKPRTFERFQEYLKILQGDHKGDLSMPISGFNPMAKDHLLAKLLELKQLNAEKIIHDLLIDMNKSVNTQSNDTCIRVALNLSDDLKGGWTNHFTSDYDSKFKFNGLYNKNFCCPLFWSSENYSIDKIKIRTKEYLQRSIYWESFPKPITMKGHLDQEIFVARHVSGIKLQTTPDMLSIQSFYEDHWDSDDYSIIFNFFYGDSASESLGISSYGIKDTCTGYDYARYLASQSLN